MLCAILVLPAISLSQNASAAPGSKTVTINDFETAAEEHTQWGNWHKWTHTTSGNGIAQATINSEDQYHGLSSTRLRVRSSISPGDVTVASMQFSSNLSRGTSPFDSIIIHYTQTNFVGWPVQPWFNFVFIEVNATSVISSTTGSLAQGGIYYAWHSLVLSPVWSDQATGWRLNISLGAVDGGDADAWIDYLTFVTSPVDIRLQYWNLYTGLGIPPEKLLAQYWTSSGGWVRVWHNEWQMYFGDSFLLKVTDIFDRDVVYASLTVTSSPQYIDVFVPLITVLIDKPADWSDVPFEWRITNLPWGPHGASGMIAPAVGFELEILAGWYNFQWFETATTQAGNLTQYIDGNASERRSFTLTNITIPLKEPDVIYNHEPKENLTSVQGLWDFLVRMASAFMADRNMQILSAILLIAGILTWLYRGKLQIEKAAEKAATRVAADQAKKEAKKQTVKFLKRQEAG
jgi:hypothetical protein